MDSQSPRAEDQPADADSPEINLILWFNDPPCDEHVMAFDGWPRLRAVDFSPTFAAADRLPKPAP